MNLEETLQQCRQYAEDGYKLAIRQYNEISNALVDEARKIESAEHAQNRMYRIKNPELIDRQKQDLKKLADYIKKIRDDIEILHERQKDFTVIVYGRTMAGKSTLMEILTHGNGDSIGRGAQRTTRDVRSYFWRGLKIFDVPGICSFGGAEDDKLAFETAKSADLILFILTDDAPQADEAKALAQLKNLGKPVLGIVNVKMAFDMKRKNLALRNLQKKLSDTERLDKICAQFKEFAANHKQNWSDIPFVYTHLNAAFQSQSGYNNDKEVFSASNFPQVENFIVDKVRNDGKFLRMKTFVDVAAVPMQKIIAAIYKRSAETLKESALYRDKVRQFASWRQNFVERSNRRINTFGENLKSSVDGAIFDFANTNYSNENAGKDWQSAIEQMNLPQRCQNFLNELAKECEAKRKSLSDQLSQELNFSFASKASTSQIEMDGTMPWGKIAFQVAAGALMFVPGVGWVARLAIGVGGALLGQLFDNKEDKIRQNKEKLRTALKDGTYPMLNTLRAKVSETFNAEILKKGVEDFGNTLNEMSYLLARLGALQGKLADNLAKKYSDLNLEILQAAVEYSRQPGFLSSIDYLARVPGKEFLIVAGRSSIDTKAVSALLSEHLSILPRQENLRVLLGLVIGGELVKKYFPTGSSSDAQDAVAFLPTIKVSETSFTLAQQLAAAPILD